MRNISASGKNFLATETSFKIAHLVAIELSSSTATVPVFSYATDYFTDLTIDGNTYRANRILTVGSITEREGLVNYKVNLTVPGELEEELRRVIIDSSSESYEDRKIIINRVYLDPQGNPIDISTDTPDGAMTYFEGTITDTSVKENITNGSSVIKWECASVFQDFERIDGRITDDAAHRGTDLAGQTGEGAKRPEYNTDTGFQHANQAISVVGQYTTLETKYKLKKKMVVCIAYLLIVRK